MATEIKTNTTTEEMDVAKALEVLKANGISIKEFAQTAKALKRGETETSSDAKVSKETSWNLLLADYPDFVIERKTPKTTKQLVIMPTQKSYYIKTVESGAVDRLTEGLYVKFTSGMPLIKLPDEFWIKHIESGKRYYSQFMQPLNNDIYIEMIQAKCAPRIDQLSIACNGSIDNDRRVKAYMAYKILFKECWNDPELRDVVCDHKLDFIIDLVKSFGLNNARDFLQSWKLSLFKKGNNYYANVFENHSRYRRNYGGETINDTFIDSCRPQYPMEYKAFKEYVLYTSVRMGYGYSCASFWTTWRDTLKMQFDIYGKIKDKYPANLPILHNQLAYKTTLHQEAIDEVKFSRQSLSTQKYEMNIGEYTFIAPRDKNDFYDEATKQANCLASYIDRYVDGACHILFMRKTKDLKDSVVTIELRGDNIVQAYQAHNVHVTADQQAALDRWLKKVIKINAGQIDGEELEELGRCAKAEITKQLLND